MPFLSNTDSVVSFTQVFICLFISIHFKMLLISLFISFLALASFRSILVVSKYLGISPIVFSY